MPKEEAARKYIDIINWIMKGQIPTKVLPGGEGAPFFMGIQYCGG